MTVVCINEYDDDIPFIRVSLNDGTVIAQGRARYKKVTYSTYKDIENPLLSIDNKYFFNPLSKRITITKIKDGEYIPFDQSTSDLDIKHWSTVKVNLLTPDVYVDQDISGCDEEVKGLVSMLNKTPFVDTVSSCSGHGRHRVYIDIRFSRLNELMKLLKIIEKHFPNDFVLSSNPHCKQQSDECVLLTLYSVEKGKEAYKKVDRLTKYLEMASV